MTCNNGQLLSSSEANIDSISIYAYITDSNSSQFVAYEAYPSLLDVGTAFLTCVFN